MRRFRVQVLVVSAVLAFAATPAAACPTCRDSLALAEARWSHGFSVSVFFLLGTLALVAGSFAFAVWRAVRNPGCP